MTSVNQLEIPHPLSLSLTASVSSLLMLCKFYLALIILSAEQYNTIKHFQCSLSLSHFGLVIYIIKTHTAADIASVPSSSDAPVNVI